MEIAGLILMGLGIIEGLFLCLGMKERNELLRANNITMKLLEEMKEDEKKSRRSIEGKFQDSLGEKYRKNPTTGLYTPIRPYRGDDEDDL